MSAQPAFTAIMDKAPTIHGVPDEAVVLALAELCAQSQTCMLVHVAAHDRRAHELVDALPFFSPHAQVIYFPAWDVMPYDRSSPNPVIVTERLQALMAMMQPASEPRIVITTIAAFSQMLPPRDELKNHAWELRQGTEIDRQKLTAWLVQHGYTANSKAVESGEFALRGSMIDIVPSGSDMGYRIDMFGDEIEHIKQYDPLTQLSQQPVENLSLLPASEVVLSEAHIQHFRSNYRDAFGAVSKADPLYEAISAGQRYVGMEHFLPLFYPSLDSLADYMPGATLTMDSDALAELEHRRELINEAYHARVEAARMKPVGVDIFHPLPPERLYLAARPQALFAYECIYQFSGFSVPASAAKGEVTGQAFSYRALHHDFHVDGKAPQNPFEKLKALVNEADNSQKKILLASYSIGSRERLLEMLANHGMPAVRVEDFAAFQAMAERMAVANVPLAMGVETPSMLMVTEQQLLGERLIRSRRKKRDADYFMAEAATFSEGELVVHQEHGIGRFACLETITAAGTSHDCLKILYADNDRLFVPVENIEVVTRYGSDDEGVELDRLGAAQWQARKAKMKERIGEIAAALMKTAAERMLRPGEVLHASGQDYAEFCARFGYMETEDQQRSIEQVEQDLMSGRPMDRLICGDVGFGKTEIALRAAFIVSSSLAQSVDLTQVAADEASEDFTRARMQVAVVVPTTLLCRQHFQNFSARFAGFGVNVRQLSRMVSAKEAKLVKEGLADGSVDIVIGTHALLAKDIRFKRLGLVVVDEEQRFGVVQKEKLKELKSDVHVLTLTATPIPRTLQLSLAGVRDLSLITTPPVDRLAVRTFVMPFDPVVLREALMREKNRGGGSFIVTPRIDDIGELKTRMAELVPELNIAVAHGQMPSADLDELMNRFYDRHVDVLLSTTIIESGLDVPHANTMIINRADRFGLAQLYQLRGRVGRSKTRAYAYLLLPPGKELTVQARKRLEVMQTLDRLGAGFTLASHDMDIRGFGNLVGDEQSGHIREVGVELYQQMLMDEIEKLKNAAPAAAGEKDVSAGRAGSGKPAAGGKPPHSAQISPPSPGEGDISPQINLGISVLIPEYYVADLPLRMGLYRRIGAAADEAELESLAAEMIDRFGALPPEAEALFTTMRFKRLCRQLRIIRLDAGPKGMVLNFAPLDELRASKLIAFLGKHPTRMKMRPDQSIFVSETFTDEADKLQKIRAFLHTMLGE